MQQATCAHSGADTGTSPGNIDNNSAPSRRALIGFVGALAIAGPVAATAEGRMRSAGEAAWDRAMREWQSAKAECKTMCDALYGKPGTFAENVACDRLINLELDAWHRLILLPAPHGQALCWKLDQIVCDDDDGFTTSWSIHLVQQFVADVRRLATTGFGIAS